MLASEIISTSFSKMAVKLGDLLELVVFYMEADGVRPCRLEAVNLQYKFPLSFILLYLQEREKIILQVHMLALWQC